MSILDRLLETDVEKLRKNEKRMCEIKRISEAIGIPFFVTCKPLTHEQVLHIAEISKIEADMRKNVVLEACEIEGKTFKTKEIMEKFGVVSGREVVERLFLPGEIFALYEMVNELSGYGKNAVEEVKN